MAHRLHAADDILDRHYDCIGVSSPERRGGADKTLRSLSTSARPHDDQAQGSPLRTNCGIDCADRQPAIGRTPGQGGRGNLDGRAQWLGREKSGRAHRRNGARDPGRSTVTISCPGAAQAPRRRTLPETILAQRPARLVAPATIFDCPASVCGERRVCLSPILGSSACWVPGQGAGGGAASCAPLGARSGRL
jgi:hypothetical protein